MDKKRYSIYIVVAVSFLTLVVIYLMFNQKKEYYILVDGITRWSYVNGEYNNVVDESYFINNKYDIYNQLNKLGNMKITQNSDGFLSYTQYMYGNEYIAVKSNDSYDVASFDIQTLNADDKEFLNDLLKSLGVNNYTDLSINQKIIYDIDNDGMSDTLYSVSNYSYNSKDAMFFNLVYVVNNAEINYLINEVVSAKTNKFLGLYKFEYLISFGNKKYNMILSYNDSDSNSHLMFDSNYKKVIDKD